MNSVKRLKRPQRLQRLCALLLICGLVLTSAVPAEALTLGGGGGAAGTGGGGGITVTEIDGAPIGTVNTIKFSNGAVTINGDGSATVVTGVGGGGDFSSSVSSSADGQIVLYSGTSGKIAKPATGTGFVMATAVGANSGIYATSQISGDCTTTGQAVITCTKINGTAFAGLAGNIVTFGSGNTPVDSGVPLSNLPTLSGNNVFNGANQFSNTGGLQVRRLVMPGGSSGTFTLIPPDNAGTSTLKWPPGTMDFSLTGGPGDVVKQTSTGAQFTVAPISTGELSGASALTVTQDPNVTLTLGGTPGVALLQPVSMTMGWTGQLSLVRGGTNANLSGTGGPGQVLQQSSAGASITVAPLNASSIGSGQALSVTSDTNVTLSLGGSASSALLAATSIAAGWTGTLGLARGGTGTNLSGTGGASFVLVQASVGAPITVRQLSASDITGLTGGGTVASVGTCTVANCFTDTAPSTQLTFQTQAAPGPPSSGTARVYVDATGGVLSVINAGGIISHGVRTLAPTAGQFLTGVNADGTYTTASAGTPTGQALTSTSDTNVTIALGGTPGTALLQPTSITMGWTGTLGVARGGTGASLASTGGASNVLLQTTAGGPVTVRQLSASDITGLTGGGTVASVGTCTVANCFTDGSPSTQMTFQTETAPAAPTGSTARIYVDTTAGTLSSINAGGIVSHTVRSLTATAGQFVTGVNNDGTYTTGPAGTPAGQALTANNDTNVTIALGGTPGTALLQPTSLTMGWTGTLGVARGGTGASLASTGGTSQVLLQTTAGGPVTVRQLAAGDISGLTGGGSITAVGTCSTGNCFTDTTTQPSSQITFQPQAAPATPASGRGPIWVDSTSAMLAVKTTTGVVGHTVRSLTATAGQFLTGVNDDGSYTTAAAGAPPGAAMTATSDTNVTLTLGGTPATSLLQATSLTMGWSGTLAVSRGGTGANLSGTGGTSQVLKQTTVGGAITVGQLAASDITGLPGGTITAVGLCTTGNCFTVANPSPQLMFQTEAAPVTPAAGSGVAWVDTTNQVLMMNQAGIVSHTARSLAASAGQFVTGLNDNGTFTTAAAGPPAGQALTTNNDTNVTLGLTGTPTTALLQSTAITAGWAGQLSVTRGGTGANLSGSSGGASFVVMQETAGGAFNVRKLSASDITGLPPGTISAVGTCTTGACFTSTVPSAQLNFNPVVAPASVTSPQVALYVDSTSLNIAAKTTAGVVNHGIRTIANATGQYVSGINDDGTVARMTPTATDVGLGNVNNTSDATKWAATAIITNKQIVPRVQTPTVTSGAITPNADITDVAESYAVSGALLTVNVPTFSGSNPVDQQRLELALKSATPVPISWATGTNGFSTTCGLSLPAGTTGDGSTYDHILFAWHADTAKWCVIASTKASAYRIMSTSSPSTTQNATFGCAANQNDRCEIQLLYTGTSPTVTVSQPGGTPNNGDMLILAMLCSATNAITWNGIFLASPNIPLPSSCPANTNAWQVAGFQYSTFLSKWQILGSN